MDGNDNRAQQVAPPQVNEGGGGGVMGGLVPNIEPAGEASPEGARPVPGPNAAVGHVVEQRSPSNVAFNAPQHPNPLVVNQHPAANEPEQPQRPSAYVSPPILMQGHLQAPPRARKMTEVNKLVPVFFILAVIGFLFGSYFHLHILQRNYFLPDNTVPSKEKVGFGALSLIYEDIPIRMTIFLVATALLLYCYFSAIGIDPGRIPHAYDPRSGHILETKRDGEFRHCKWCSQYKPDRAHHCRVLGQCVLKMDHHCPWLYNTVGFHNHKMFFLTLFYANIILVVILSTMYETVMILIEENTTTTFGEQFVALYTESLAGFLLLVVGTFFLFHCFLVVKNLTTIEFCEKNSGGIKWNAEASRFDEGTYGNIVSALGSNPLFWLLPFQAAEGDGLVFVTERTKLRIEPVKGKVV